MPAPHSSRAPRPLPVILPWVAAILVAFLPSGLTAQAGAAGSGSPPDTRELLRDRFQGELGRLAEGFGGVSGIHVVDLASGERFDVLGDGVFPQASAIKIPILLELFRQAEADPGLLARRVEMTDEVRTGGSGVLQLLTHGGSALSFEDLAILMIVHSDNTATNVLIDALGMEAVNRLSAELGAPRTLLRRKMIRPEASARGEENVSTPREAAHLMERIAACDLPMSPAACARVTGILALPKGGPTRAPVPAEVPIAFKPGGITGVSTTWALVELPGRPYVLTVMASWGGDGNALVEAVSRAAWGYFSRLAGATPYGNRVPVGLLDPPR